MSTPRLHVFAISHFCEKARFALDYLEIDYRLGFEAPGLHMRTAKRLGVSGTSLPILVAADEVVQGSGEIIDWADANTRGERRLTPESEPEAGECRKIEQRLDDGVGVHTRRCFYSEALVEHPETVKPAFTRDLDMLPKAFVGVAWGRIRRLMIEGMDLGSSQGEESRKLIERELDWLDGLLSDGRRYLVDDRFTRADLTAASLLARMADPEEHPNHRFMHLPPRLDQARRGWADRPSLTWIRGLYRAHRPTSTTRT